MTQGEEGEEHYDSEGHSDGGQEHEACWENGLDRCRTDAHTLTLLFRLHILLREIMESRRGPVVARRLKFDEQLRTIEGRGYLEPWPSSAVPLHYL
jgi:hypothetical protein